MRALLVATALLAFPCVTFAQSTVGSVPSNPNTMPAVNGSSAPVVSGTNSTTAGATAATQKPSAIPRKHSRKALSDPH